MSEDRPITLADLAAAGACVTETAIFKDHWGDGNVLTYERCMSEALTFDWPFAARHLLTDLQERHFRALIAVDFRHIPVGSDPTQEKRRRAMCRAFYKAWNSPKE
jgi:hypothetical protein